jgi:hypothetical protein
MTLSIVIQNLTRVIKAINAKGHASMVMLSVFLLNVIMLRGVLPSKHLRENNILILLESDN